MNCNVGFLSLSILTLLPAAPVRGQSGPGNPLTIEELRGETAAGRREAREHFKKSLKDLEKKLEECHHGKRPERDRYVILNRLVPLYQQLGMQKEAEAANREFGELSRELLEKDPDFLKGNRPMELSEEKADREERERKRWREKEELETLRPKATSYIPRDSKVFDVFLTTHHAMAAYQYRLEFYKIPRALPSGTVEVSSGVWDSGGKRVSIARPSDPKQRFLLQLLASNQRAEKVMRFRSPVSVSVINWSDELFVACVDTLNDYTAVDEEETRISAAHPRGTPYGGIPWKDEKAEYGDFCGIVSIRGKVVYRFPYEQNPKQFTYPYKHTPGMLLLPRRFISRKPDAVLTGADCRITEGHHGVRPGECLKVLVWKYPETFKLLDLSDPSPETEIGRISCGDFGDGISTFHWTCPHECQLPR